MKNNLKIKSNLKKNILSVFDIHKITRFFIIGCSTVFIDFIMYMILSGYIVIPLAKAISKLFTMPFSFYFNKCWTFSNGNSINKKLIIRFIIVQCINFFVNITVNSTFIYLKNDKIIAFIIATVITGTINYILQNTYVFINKTKICQGKEI